MARSFAAGKHAFGFCDVCGFRYPLRQLRPEVVNLVQTDIRACPECWSPDQPQNRLGTINYSDPQALRNPRPTGATSGRDLSYAQRWEFASVTELTSPTRFNGWHVNSKGTLAHNSAESMLTLTPTGDTYIMNGYNSGPSFTTADNVNLGINASVYKYATVMARMNDFPTEPGPPDDWDGKIFWGNDTTITNRLVLTHLVIDASGNATFTYTYSGTSQVAVGNRYNFYNLSGTYNGSDISVLNGIPAAPASGFRDKYMVTAVTESTFTVSETGITGDGSTLALSGTPSARCPWPYTSAVFQNNTERPTPYFMNSQPSSGFLASQKSFGTYFKFVWDLSDHEYWTGTISTIRFDFFGTDTDETGGSMDIQWIAVQSYHNPDL